MTDERAGPGQMADPDVPGPGQMAEPDVPGPEQMAEGAAPYPDAEPGSAEPDLGEGEPDVGEEPATDEGAGDQAADAAGGEDRPLRDPRVVAALERIDELADTPPSEHVEIYEDVHRTLQEVLAEASRHDEDQRGAEDPDR